MCDFLYTELLPTAESPETSWAIEEYNNAEQLAWVKH